MMILMRIFKIIDEKFGDNDLFDNNADFKF